MTCRRPPQLLQLGQRRQAFQRRVAPDPQLAVYAHQGVQPGKGGKAGVVLDPHRAGGMPQSLQATQIRQAILRLPRESGGINPSSEVRCVSSSSSSPTVRSCPSPSSDVKPLRSCS